MDIYNNENKAVIDAVRRKEQAHSYKSISSQVFKKVKQEYCVKNG